MPGRPSSDASNSVHELPFPKRVPCISLHVFCTPVFCEIHNQEHLVQFEMMLFNEYAFLL